MNWGLILAVVVGILGLFTIGFYMGRARRGVLRVRYSRGGAWLSEDEHEFFDVLHEALKNVFHVFPKVRLEELVEARSGFLARLRFELLSLSSRYHADFALFDPHDFRIVGVVELDGSFPAETGWAKWIENNTDATLRSARIPLVHFESANRLSCDEVRHRVLDALPARNSHSGVRYCRLDAERVWIAMQGEAIWHNSIVLRDFVQGLQTEGVRFFFLDLESCHLMDSTFMGTLISLSGKMSSESSGALVIVQASTNCRRQLALYGLDSLLLAPEEDIPLLSEEDKMLFLARAMPKEEMRRAILAAHEALVASSEENRLRFRDALDFLRGKEPEINPADN